jgi:hypothetical protein
MNFDFNNIIQKDLIVTLMNFEPAIVVSLMHTNKKLNQIALAWFETTNKWLVTRLNQSIVTANDYLELLHKPDENTKRTHIEVFMRMINQLHDKAAEKGVNRRAPCDLTSFKRINWECSNFNMLIKKVNNEETDFQVTGSLNTPDIYKIAAEGDLRNFCYLLDYYDNLFRQEYWPSYKLPKSKGRSVLSIAAAEGNTEIVQFLTDVALKPDHKHKWPVCQPSEEREMHIGSFAVLLINQKDLEGNTALHLAAKHGHIDNVGILSKCDIINVRNKVGICALSYAAKRSDYSILRILLDHGANPINHDEMGRLPIHYAASTSLRIVKVLLPFLNDINFQDNEGKTLLHYAINNEEITQFLLEKKANPNIADKSGQKPLHFAKDSIVDSKDSKQLKKVIKLLTPFTSSDSCKIS